MDHLQQPCTSFTPASWAVGLCFTQAILIVSFLLHVVSFTLLLSPFSPLRLLMNMLSITLSHGSLCKRKDGWLVQREGSCPDKAKGFNYRRLMQSTIKYPISGICSLRSSSSGLSFPLWLCSRCSPSLWMTDQAQHLHLMPGVAPLECRGAKRLRQNFLWNILR